jgi:hypothetical protein
MLTCNTLDYFCDVLVRVVNTPAEDLWHCRDWAKFGLVDPNKKISVTPQDFTPLYRKTMEEYKARFALMPEETANTPAAQWRSAHVFRISLLHQLELQIQQLEQVQKTLDQDNPGIDIDL